MPDKQTDTTPVNPVAEVIDPAPQTEEQQILVKLSINEQRINELREQFAVVPDTTTEEGYAEAKAALKVLVPIRTSLDKARTAITKEARDYVENVNKIGNGYVSDLKEIEAPIAAAVKRADDVEKERLAELDRKEAERVANRQADLSNISKLAEGLLGATSDVIRTRLDEAKAIECTPAKFDEFVEPATLARDDVVSKLTMALESTLNAEEVQAENKRQQAKLEADRKEFEDAQAEQRKKDADAAAARKLEDDKKQADADKTAEDLRVAQQKLDDIEAEKTAKAKKKKEDARIKAMMPDVEKLREFTQSLIELNTPEVTDDGCQRLLDMAKADCNDVADRIKLGLTMLGAPDVKEEENNGTKTK